MSERLQGGPGQAGSLFEPLQFARGAAMRNRLALAPLTNLQSNDDGTITPDEFAFLVKRAQAGFGMVMTCGATVSPLGKGYPRQLGIHDDRHLPGLAKLAQGLRAAGAQAVVQIMHSGWRAKRDLIGTEPVGVCHGPGVRGLTTGEVQQVIEDFIVAGIRAERAGFDGVEIHGAHGYLLCEFLDTVRNQRSDRYGGSAEGRSRPITEIVAGLRARTGPDFQIGVRLSPERYGIAFDEALALAAKLMTSGTVDYVDVSCWDVGKQPEDPRYHGRTLLDCFAELPRGRARLGVAGKLTTAAAVFESLRQGADFVLIGRGAILHHDFPARLRADPGFVCTPLPVSRAHLHDEGLGPHFIDYMRTWAGFVAD
ncbi:MULTISPECIES: NADH:flavin oxidoreductase [unclassified Sphingobium]|uniref:NADH:flavin oxidoreductase n=1 Tax=unclassified Sphingobium TaxID=2611147 RepID=UPI0035A622D1